MWPVSQTDSGSRSLVTTSRATLDIEMKCLFFEGCCVLGQRCWACGVFWRTPTQAPWTGEAIRVQLKGILSRKTSVTVRPFPLYFRQKALVDSLTGIAKQTLPKISLQTSQSYKVGTQGKGGYDVKAHLPTVPYYPPGASTRDIDYHHDYPPLMSFIRSARIISQIIREPSARTYLKVTPRSIEEPPNTNTLRMRTQSMPRCQ